MFNNNSQVRISASWCSLSIDFHINYIYKHAALREMCKVMARYQYNSMSGLLLKLWKTIFISIAMMRLVNTMTL